MAPKAMSVSSSMCTDLRLGEFDRSLVGVHVLGSDERECCLLLHVEISTMCRGPWKHSEGGSNTRRSRDRGRFPMIPSYQSRSVFPNPIADKHFIMLVTEDLWLHKKLEIQMYLT
jgi:hypothetical protein